jgi:ATPase subunit of ABC transporter with duplicated ATPase domains
MYKILGSSNFVYFVNKNAYEYRIRETSITHNVTTKDAEDIYENTREMKEYIEKYYSEMSEMANVYIVARLLNALIISYKVNKSSTVAKKIEDNLAIIVTDKKVRKSLKSGQRLRLALMKLNLLKFIY